MSFDSNGKFCKRGGGDYEKEKRNSNNHARGENADMLHGNGGLSGRNRNRGRRCRTEHDEEQTQGQRRNNRFVPQALHGAELYTDEGRLRIRKLREGQWCLGRFWWAGFPGVERGRDRLPKTCNRI